MKPINTSTIPYEDFLNRLKETFRQVFYERYQIEKSVLTRGFPAIVLRDIMAANPFSVAIPKKYGGRGGNVKESIGIIDAAAYESLPLALTFGINIALFLEPVAKYAQEKIKEHVFNRFMTQQNMGGLMITEPNYGSDALNMQTSFTEKNSQYHISGVKHWQGLTGLADFWLMTARKRASNGNLDRDIHFFITDEHIDQQKIEVESIYNNIGLYPIPYGKNNVHIIVPEQNRLIPQTTGIKLLLDLLHRSRLQFPGMGMGFIRRMLNESIQQCNRRYIGGSPIMKLDQVQFQIGRIQSAYTISSALCVRSAQYSGIENDLSSATIEANSMKAYITDLMQEASQTLTQLNGANGYKAECIGARGIIDSRPFQIFEGANELLYTQIAEGIIKRMARHKTQQLNLFLKQFPLTLNASDFLNSTLNIHIKEKLPQRKLVDLGKIIARVIAAHHVLNLSNKGFRNDLISNSLDTIKHEISILITSYHAQTNIKPIETYENQSQWMNFTD